MKLTEKQAMMLYQIAIASMNIVNDLAFSQDDRKKLLNDILNQQDNTQILSDLSTNTQ